MIAISATRSPSRRPLAIAELIDLPDDVITHHEAVLEAWFLSQMTGVDV
jgi:hypothetical protein